MPISDRRHLLIPALLALAACGHRDAPSAADMPGAEVIRCAIAKGGGLDQRCALERSRSPAGLSLVVRHPDGGFRRLLVTADGRQVIAADGALPAAVRVIGPREIEITVDGDRYRLPATLRGGPLTGR